MLDNGVFYCESSILDINLNKIFGHGYNDLILEINDHYYKSVITTEEIELFFRFIRKEWLQLQSSILFNDNPNVKDPKQIRSTINKCLRMILKSIEEYIKINNSIFFDKNDVLKNLYSLASLLTPLQELEEDLPSPLPYKFHYLKTDLIYVYFHTNLDVKYYLFLIIDTLGENNNEILEKMIKDLIFFNKKSLENDEKFNCNCVENFWSFLRNYCKNFWQIFQNQCQNENPSFVLELTKNILSPECELDFTYLENVLNELLKTKEPTLKDLKNLDLIICNEYRIHLSRIEIYQMLWEYFGRKLNESKQPLNVRQIKFQEIEKNNEEFIYFVKMLVKHLNRHPNQWIKIKGRIYSQLGPMRIRNLNDVGIYHILMLFLSLTTINCSEATKQFLNVLDHLEVEKKNTEIVWKIYEALILKYVKDGWDLKEMIEPFIKMLEKASFDEKFHLIKDFIVTFQDIIESSKNYQLNQQMLLNSWIPKYIRKCTLEELKKFLQVLLNTINMVDDIEYQWTPCYLMYVRDSLKTVCTSQNPPEIVGALAAKISLLNLTNLKEDFEYYNKDTIPIQISSRFLEVILENYPQNFSLNEAQEKIVLQRWIQMCILIQDEEKFLPQAMDKFTILSQNFKQNLTFDGFLNQLIPLSAENIKLSKICFEHTDWLKFVLENSENELTIKRCYRKFARIFNEIGHLLYDRRKSNSVFSSLVDILLLPIQVMMGKPLNVLILNAIRETWPKYLEAIQKLKTPNDAYIERILKDLIIKYIPYYNIDETPILECFTNEELLKVIMDKFALCYLNHSTQENEGNISKCLRLLAIFFQRTTLLPLIRIVIDKTLYGIFEIFMFHNQRKSALNVLTTIFSSPLYKEINENFVYTIILIVEKHLSINSTKCFQLLFLLVKYIPEDLKSIIARLEQQITKVEKQRGVGFDSNLRNNLSNLKKLLSS